MSFPQIIATLGDAGFEGYHVDYRCNSATYFLPDEAPIILETPSGEEGVALRFDQPGIVAQIQWAQSNPPGYSYPAFSRNVKELGCAGYFVSICGRRVVYYGRTGELHIEDFPV